jgi:uncharacterized membrane protein YhhN
MKTRILSVLYFLSGITFIVLQYKPGFLPDFAVKALIMPLLILIFMVNTRRENANVHWYIFSALLFSWAGDIVLEFTRKNENMFIIGLVCFLLAHVLYFIVFCLTPGRSYTLMKLGFFILPVFLYGTGLLYYLYDDLGNMRIPVIVYSIVILTMLAGAISRIKKVSMISYYLVLSGAVLFVLSDSLIAINKFSCPFKGASALIMSTYMTGQFLIVIGYLKQHRKDLFTFNSSNNRKWEI